MKTTYTEDPARPGEERALRWLPNRTRHLLLAFLGEFIGTFLFLFFAFAATQTANNLLGDRDMDIGSLMYISLAFGFSLAVNVWIFFRVSGGLFNPAVSRLFRVTQCLRMTSHSYVCWSPGLHS
jgi:aquaporin related protein